MHPRRQANTLASKKQKKNLHSSSSSSCCSCSVLTVLTVLITIVTSLSLIAGFNLASSHVSPRDLQEKVLLKAKVFASRFEEIRKSVAGRNEPKKGDASPFPSRLREESFQFEASQIQRFSKSHEEIQHVLHSHPLFNITAKLSNPLVGDVLIRMQAFPKCQNKPIFITMARIGTPLYWQLVENFMYSMVNFDIFECSLMICVEDNHCMELCQHSSFPCFYYDDHSGSISTFQKIANLKLHALPMASAKGVDIFMVDLDVGFRKNPMLLVEEFMNDSTLDIMVQKDIAFVMNRSVAGWRTWYTKPVVNIGLFAFKGNFKVEHMFKRAWRVYQKHDSRLDQPGTDQSIIQDCIYKSYDNKRINLSWAFFPDRQVALVDKIYKFESRNIELGGTIAEDILSDPRGNRDAIAVHATCYEMKVKVHALKAVGAFWNPYYYDPGRRTLTMKLYFRGNRQVRSVVNALAWLALATNRSLIIPNVLADESKASTDFQCANLTKEGHVLWPGWRVMKIMNDEFPLTVLEPGYYWKLKRYYKTQTPVPDPFILTTPEVKSQKVLKLLKEHDDKPRVVLNIVSHSALSSPATRSTIERMLERHVSDSIGVFSNFSFEYDHSPHLIPTDDAVPGLKFHGSPVYVHRAVRACSRILDAPIGNRSCFDKCK